jgi:serine protease Do
MISIKPTMGITLFLCLLLTGTPALSVGETSEKVYPLSLTELDEELFGWLTHAGFEVRRTFLEMGQVKLKGVRAEENWEIILKHHSPLATKVQAIHRSGDNPNGVQLQKLWDRILAYMEVPSYDSENSNQGIPTAVLSRLESVVCIKAKVGEEHFRFSGFIVNEEGLIISTAHIPQAVQSVRVTLYDGRKVKGRLVKIDPHRDLALVQAELRPETFISLAKGRNFLGMGERLYAIGCPIDLRGSINSGIINGPPRRLNDLVLWQADMKVYPGSSGSPVFDVQGNLVAVVKGRYRGTDSVGFLIPFETIMEFAKESSFR